MKNSTRYGLIILATINAAIFTSSAMNQFKEGQDYSLYASFSIFWIVAAGVQLGVAAHRKFPIRK